ncbi:prepilin-type N-terminal cleavage/methylation domain-containing protein [Candidatus Peregrinibacteria bacterium]|nr:prepilin-type N-terminal cleavage/methylation domain-containing protein [Candidatus Peregrinibacteria bacterium]
MQKQYKNSGFTLVELLVSVGITAILMVGISTFFSSTFRNMFIAREKVTNTQSEFVVNTILNGKFANTVSLVDGGTGDYALLQNDMATGDLPFTYVGKEDIDGADHIVFKDFFIFNGKYGSLSSQSATEINNPAGLAPLGAKAYVAAPLENDIYACNPAVLNNCQPLNIPDLDQPIGVTTNTSDAIYVTDAGNGRILEITNLATSKNVREVASGFNYPTGIAYYGDYLFVSDTYDHTVKKVAIADGTTEVVVGDGDDEVCDPDDGRDHTASFCKLSFPTGLVVGDDGSGEALFIADTGNGRILKVSDPQLDLSNHEILATISGVTEILNIDFIFSADVTINSIAEGVNGNELRTGRYEIDGNTVRFHLSAPMIEDYTELECVGPDPCISTRFLRGFDVLPENNLFETGDTIEIDGDSYTVLSSYNVDDTTDRVEVDPTDTENFYDDGTVVRITGTFSGEKKFHLDLNDIDFGSVFNSITTEIYDSTPVLNSNPVDFQVIRVGDGELGTPEDTIEEVYEVVSSAEFLTGLAFNGTTLEKSTMPKYSPDFADFDYTSDFEVQNFAFSEPNTGQILELYFEALLGEDSEGNPLWEQNTLNANIGG